MKGTVKSIVKNNYGFIRASNEAEYFFHREDFNGFWEDLVADTQIQPVEVTFDIVASQKGPRAGNVRRTDFPNQT